MANNFKQPGSVISVAAPYQRDAGKGAKIGSIFGVALATVASGATGQFQTDGVWTLDKTSAQAWTVGQLIGVATVAADNPSSTGTVRLNGVAPDTAEGPQAAEADLTDNSGGAAADGTIGVVTAPTSLTDNGGGTADGTVASQAAPVTLTDSTGLSGSHDDTLAATTVPADITGGESPTEAEHNTLLAVVRVLAQNGSDVGQKIIELVTLATTAQNNLKELTTAQAQNRTAIVALTDAVKELSTKQNALLAKLRIAGIIAS